MPPAVLITGAAKRIGALLARRFAAEGWHVVLHHGQSGAEARTLAAGFPSAEAVGCDLADTAAALAMVGDLATHLPDWRVLVNCAAVFEEDGETGIDRQVFDRAMAINARTPAMMTQAFLRQARSAQGRRAIQFLDQKLLNPNPDFYSYTMAKHALAATVRMQAMATPDPRDRVYGLAPGAMLPSFDQLEHEHEVSGRMNLLGRLTDPEELAEAALFLSAGWLASGETIFVDSGQHLLAQRRDVLYLARE